MLITYQNGAEDDSNMCSGGDALDYYLRKDLTIWILLCFSYML
jgi:hypothetical protein